MRFYFEIVLRFFVLMQAVILAGGRGTRLSEISGTMPKSMVKIGGRPVLEHQIDLMKRYGIREVFVITGYLAEAVEDYFLDGSGFDVDISYYREQFPLGTTGGIKEIEDRLNNDFLVLYSDVMVNMNLARLIDFHKSREAACTLTLHPNNHPYDSDLVDIDENQRITGFFPNPRRENIYFRNLVNAGLYVMSARMLNHIERGVKADFGRDIFPEIFQEEPLYGYITSEYLKDIGTPDRYEQVERDFISGKVEKFNSENKRRAVFLDRDGVINRDVDLLSRAEDFELLPGTDNAVKRFNNSDFLTIVITNQSVVARNLCSMEKLGEIHKKMETLLGMKGAVLDAVYFCPHHPDKGYPEENRDFKIECECRKPATGLVKKAVEDYNIELSGSYFIGDSVRDILCGRNAGVTTVGVRTGSGCRDGGEEPDYFFRDLQQAAAFIVEEPLADYFFGNKKDGCRIPQNTFCHKCGRKCSFG